MSTTVGKQGGARGSDRSWPDNAHIVDDQKVAGHLPVPWLSARAHSLRQNLHTTSSWQLSTHDLDATLQETSVVVEWLPFAMPHRMPYSHAHLDDLSIIVAES